jgi:putative ABC transport system permease protein
VTLARSYLRATRGRTTVLCAGLSAVALAFALLTMNAPAPVVRVGGRLLSLSPSPDYDILVAPAANGLRAHGGPSITGPADLSAMTGGISLAQYGVIRQLPGVEIAAPMAMIGYVPVRVTFLVTVPTAAITTLPKLFTLMAVLRGGGGLGAVTKRDAGGTYLIADPLFFNSGADAPGSGEIAESAVAIRAQACPSQTSRALPVIYVAAARRTECPSGRTGRGPDTSRGAPPSAISVPVGWTFLLPLIAVDPAAEARLAHLDKAVIQGRYLPATTVARFAPVPMIVASSIYDNDEVQLSATALAASRPTGTATVTAAAAYSLLVGHIGAGALTVPAYWTDSASSFGQSAQGGSLTRHAARVSNPGRASSGAALAAIGVFDPGKVASSPATPSPYRATRQVAPYENPVGYPSSATLVMPLQDIAAFTAPGAYADTDPGEPIASIRVVVTGGTGDGPLSIARVRAVAQQIVRATGLHVDVTVSTTSTVAIGLDPLRLELSILVLPLGVAFFANGVSATLHGRRRDLLTLRALGWGRRHLTQQLLQEFALIAAGGWLLAAVVATAVGRLSLVRPTSWLLLVGSGAGLAATLAAAWWLVRQATGEPLRRSPRGTALGVLVIALGCAALGQELAVRWVFHGILVGSALGRAVVWQSNPADLAAAATILALTTLAVADMHWLNIGKRALELRTLHAIGWPAESVVRLVVVDAVLVGAIGGLAGCAADLAGSLAILHRVPAGVLLVAAAVAVLGVGMSLVALGLAALARRRLHDLDGSHARERTG